MMGLRALPVAARLARPSAAALPRTSCAAAAAACARAHSRRALQSWAPSSSPGAAAPGLVGRLNSFVPDVDAGVAFYTEALRLRAEKHMPGRVAVLGEGGVGCRIRLWQRKPREDMAGAGAGAAAPATFAGLRYPYVTYGVSNLKTSARHAKRKGGDVVGEPGISTPSAIAECVFVDPFGRGMRVLHLFRRTPAISVTVGCADPSAAAERFYTHCLGMRVIGADSAAAELAELHLPPLPASSHPATDRVVLAYGPAHMSTCLVLEKTGLTAQAHPPPADPADDVGAAPILGLGLPHEQLAEAHARVSALGLPATPFDPAKDTSFTCMDPDGTTILDVYAAAGEGAAV